MTQQAPPTDWSELEPARSRESTAAPFSAITTTRLLVQGSGCLSGWAIRDATATPGLAWQADLLDGQDGNGPIIASFSEAAMGSSSESYDGYGVQFERGLFLRVTVGSITGAVFFRMRRRRQLPEDAPTERY